MNWISIVGYIIVFIGSLVIYYGTIVDSRKQKEETKEESAKDKAELKKEFEQVFTTQLNQLKNENPSREKIEKIAQLNDQFQDWAQEFTTNKEKYKLEYQKSDIGLRESQLKINYEWRNFYVEFFHQLDSFVEAYNEIPTNKKVEILHKDPIPLNIYTATSKNPKFILKFNDTTFWKVSIYVPNEFREDLPPSIEIDVNNSNEFGGIWADLIVKPNSKLNEVLIQKDRAFINLNIKDYYSLENQKQTISEILKTAFQYQLVKLDSN